MSQSGDLIEIRRFAAQAAMEFLAQDKRGAIDYAILVLASALVDYLTVADGPPLDVRKDSILFACRTAQNRRGLSDALRHAIAFETFVTTGSHSRAIAVARGLREQFETIEQVHDMRSRVMNPSVDGYSFSLSNLTDEDGLLNPSWRPWAMKVSPESQASIARACAEDQTLSREAPVGTLPGLRHWVEGYECGRRDASRFSSDPLAWRPAAPNIPLGTKPPMEEDPPASEMPMGGDPRADQQSGSGHERSQSSESSVGGVATPTVGKGGRVGNDPAAEETDRPGEDLP